MPVSSEPDSLGSIIIDLEHLVWPENEEVLRKKQGMWACRREEGANLKELLTARANFSNKINSVVLHNNTKHNICIHMTWIYAKSGNSFLRGDFQILVADTSFRSLRLKFPLIKPSLRPRFVSPLKGRGWEEPSTQG